MKKKVKTIVIIIIVFLITALLYYVASNINVLKDKFDDYFVTTTKSTTTTTTTTKKRTTTSTTKYAKIDVDSILKNVRKEKGKVNIYFFYGEGCPHCEHEHEAFKEIESEYGKYYNLHEFEMWYNDTNRSLAHIFAEKLNVDLKGVPFTVIGEQYISGFGEETKQVLIDTIEKEKDKGYDLYIDEIKEQ